MPQPRGPIEAGLRRLAIICCCGLLVVCGVPALVVLAAATSIALSLVGFWAQALAGSMIFGLAFGIWRWRKRQDS